MNQYSGLYADDGVPCRAYRDAVRSQDASNLSGILHSWQEIVGDIASQHGSDYAAQHPINVLYATQAMHLMGAGMFPDGAKYGDAYWYCQRRAGL